jgi:hypothetical protein
MANDHNSPADTPYRPFEIGGEVLQPLLADLGPAVAFSMAAQA